MLIGRRIWTLVFVVQKCFWFYFYTNVLLSMSEKQQMWDDVENFVHLLKSKYLLFQLKIPIYCCQVDGVEDDT